MSERAFPGFLGDFFWLLNSLKKGGVWRIHSFLVKWCRLSIESPALMCPFKQSNLGAWSLLSWHPTHTHLRVRLSVFSKLFALHRHGYAEWLGLCEEQRFSSTISVNSHKHYREYDSSHSYHRVHAHPAVAYEIVGDCSDEGGSLLCPGPRRRHEEMAWKRKRIKTSLVVVIFLLRVNTYDVFCKLFWNWIGVVQFLSHEVWSDEGFVIWHFLSCRL